MSVQLQIMFNESERNAKASDSSKDMNDIRSHPFLSFFTSHPPLYLLLYLPSSTLSPSLPPIIPFTCPLSPIFAAFPLFENEEYYVRSCNNARNEKMLHREREVCVCVCLCVMI